MLIRNSLIRLSSLFIFAIASNSACAQYGQSALSGFYGGLGLGFTKANYSASNQKVTIHGMQVPLSQTTMFPTDATVTTTNSGMGMRLYAGYLFQDIFAVEMGLSKYAKTKINNVFGISDNNPVDLPAPPFPTNTTLVGDRGTVKQMTLDLMGKIDIPILESFHGFFQAGAAYVQLNHPSTVEVDTTHISPGVTQLSLSVKNIKDYAVRPAFAIGAGYVVDPNFTVDLTLYKLLASGQNLGLNFGGKAGGKLIQSSMMVLISVGYSVS